MKMRDDAKDKDEDVLYAEEVERYVREWTEYHAKRIAEDADIQALALRCFKYRFGREPHSAKETGLQVIVDLYVCEVATLIPKAIGAALRGEI